LYELEHTQDRGMNMRKTILLLLTLLVVFTLSVFLGNKNQVAIVDPPKKVVKENYNVKEEEKSNVEQSDADKDTIEESTTETPIVQPEAPIIEFESTHIKLGAGSKFDLKVGITLKDNKDTPEALKTAMKVFGDPIFNINKVGSYTITYKVTDSDGNLSTATRTFEVTARPVTKQSNSSNTTNQGSNTETGNTSPPNQGQGNESPSDTGITPPPDPVLVNETPPPLDQGNGDVTPENEN
jgi:hypothetical protein